MAEDRPHNAQDGRCRYTLGAARCPAPGVVRVGQWWVCSLHECWAEDPADPALQEEGRAALRLQQERHGLGPAEPEAGVGGPVGGRAEAWRAMDQALGGALEQAREARRAKIRRLAEDHFRRLVREQQAAGLEPVEARRRAVGEVAVTAIEQRWGSGR